MAANGQLTVAAILVAAGDGVRLGAAVPKAFCTVGGRTFLEHAVGRFVGHPGVRDVIVVAPAAFLEQARALTDSYGCAVVAGAPTRPGSVRAGLASLVADVDAVLVHDVARPFVPADVITRVVAALVAGADAVVPAIAVIDTIKSVSPDGEVLATVDRSTLRAIQTPQGFRRAALVAAHAGDDSDITDDAGLIERAGGRVVVVDGADESFKITRPWDLLVAEAIYARSERG